jgi:signal transduction histidine kinase
MIAETAQRATALVGDLLDFTRGRLGAGIPVKRLEGNLGKIVHDVASEIEDAHPRCHLRVETRDQGSGQWDGARMSQALTNLIGNAVEHSSDGTTVKVELSGNETHACISIHNRGAVIPPSRLPTLFLPMQPEREPSRNRSGPGGNLGLGLYIAERIIFAHGGRIEVESSEVAGTTFTIHVPRRQ